MAHHECIPESMQWKVVPGFEAYEVSEYGHLRRIRPHRSRPIAGYILKPKPHKGGYLHYDVSMNGRYRRLYAHRAVALAFLGPPLFPRAQAAHKDGNKHDNHYTNIYWATHWENAQDNIRHGVTNAGEMSPTHKITWEIATEIRKAYCSTLQPYARLAEFYGISQECVRAVLQGDTWNDGTIKPQSLIRHGETSPKAKLSQADVDEIRHAYFADKVTQAALAKRYGVKKNAIWLALHNHSWHDPDYTPQTRAFGEQHLSAKLTDQSVKAIRQAYAAGTMSQRALARQYQVDRKAIQSIIHHVTWKHVGA